MISSCAGEEIAASTFISLPQVGHRLGSSNHVRAMSLAQLRRPSRTNSLSGPWTVTTVGAPWEPPPEAAFLTQPSLLRTVVETAP
jgi:hypothetical protein